MYDVTIIGAGISGCSLAYELSKYNVKAVLVEKENDVSIGTTKVYFNEVGYSVADMVAAYAAAPEGLTAEQVQLLADFAAAYSA